MTPVPYLVLTATALLTLAVQGLLTAQLYGQGPAELRLVAIASGLVTALAANLLLLAAWYALGAVFFLLSIPDWSWPRYAISLRLSSVALAPFAVAAASFVLILLSAPVPALPWAEDAGAAAILAQVQALPHVRWLSRVQTAALMAAAAWLWRSHCRAFGLGGWQAAASLGAAGLLVAVALLAGRWLG